MGQFAGGGDVWLNGLLIFKDFNSDLFWGNEGREGH